ncbi:Dual oxidase 1 [Gonapodya sp. JEL0774]|nr:Dual oxidase 1 [Gonapodya sp. JEL0774]
MAHPAKRGPLVSLVQPPFPSTTGALPTSTPSIFPIPSTPPPSSLTNSSSTSPAANAANSTTGAGSTSSPLPFTSGTANTFSVKFPQAPTDNHLDDEPWREFPPWDGFYNNLAVPTLNFASDTGFALGGRYAGAYLVPGGGDVSVFALGKFLVCLTHPHSPFSSAPANQGAIDSPMLIWPPPQYTDGIEEPAGEHRPNPRTLSVELMSGPTGMGSTKGKTAFMTFFGQQVVEEILDAQRPHCPVEYFNIPIPKGDPLYDPKSTGDAIIPLLRNRYEATTGHAINGPRVQINEITPWIDGGLVYGTARAWSDALRTHVGGTLATDASGKFPQYNDVGLPMFNPAPPRDHKLKSPFRIHKLGNPRGNENPMLLSMGVLWFREHNFQAARLQALHPNWDDERLFNEARRWVIALHQKVVTEEWFPVFAGRPLPPYRGYDPSRHPQISVIFQAAAMRYGHTLVPPAVWRRTVGTADPQNPAVGRNGSCQFLNNKLFRTCNSYWNPNEYLGADTSGQFAVNATGAGNNGGFRGAFPEGSQTDLAEFLLGLTAQVTEKEDNIITEDLRGFVFGPLEMSRRDLMAINIQRGREEGGLNSQKRSLWVNPKDVFSLFAGIPDYNTARRFFNLTRKTSFQDITGDWDIPVNGVKPIAKKMEDLYHGDLDDIDTWVGGLLETTQGEMGELFGAILVDQFSRIRDADRFWFANPTSGYFTPAEVDFIRSPENSMRSIIIRNTGIPDWAIQDDVWHEPPPTFYCHQPKQINSTDTAELTCTPPEQFDYLKLSGYQITGVIFVSIFLMIFAGLTVPLARWWRSRLIRRARAAAKKKDRLSTRKGARSPLIREAQEFAGKDLADVFPATECAGKDLPATHDGGAPPKPDSADPSDGTAVTVLLSDNKLQLVNPRDTAKVIREVAYDRLGDILIGELSEATPEGNVDFRGQTSRKWMMFGSREAVQLPEIVLQVPKEYDIWLRFTDSTTRDEFVARLTDYQYKARLPRMSQLLTKKHRELMSIVKSRAQRTVEIEQFFREIANIIAPQSRGGGNGTGTRSGTGWFKRDSSGPSGGPGGLAQAELSRDEFAAAFRVDRNSLFATQIFNWVDKDSSGYVSFRELLDMMVIFNNGSVDAKTRLLFDLHDLDGNGSLSKEELLTMLTSLLSEGSAAKELDKSTLNNATTAVVDTWWKEVERRRGGPVDMMNFEDFRHVMNTFGENVIQAITIAGVLDAPSDAQSAPQSTLAPTVSRGLTTAGGAAGNSAVNRALTSAVNRNRNLVENISRGSSSTSRLRSPTPLSKRIGTEVLTRSTTSAPQAPRKSSRFGFWKAYITNKRREIIFLIFFFASTLGIFFERFYVYYHNKEHGGLRQITGYGVATWTGFLMSIIHIVGHFFNFYNFSTQPSDDMLCYFRDVYHYSDELLSFFYYCWQTVTGFSGLVLTVLMVLIYTYAHEYVRRNVFTVFWFFHRLHPIWYLAMIVHGAAQLVQPPFYWYFMLVPTIVYRLDSVFTAKRRAFKVPIIEAALLPSEVTLVKMRKPSNFDYKAGQWLRIALPEISTKEFHPFTISSAPNDPYLSVHIRTVGPWTTRARDVLGATVPGSAIIDGPFGGGHGDYARYPVAIFVGGGIGVTPFASIMKELVFNANKAPGIFAQQRIRKAYFIWVARSQKQFEWMVDLIKDLEEQDELHVLDAHVFITAITEKYDLRTTMLYITERSFARINGQSLFTGLRSQTHFGRPNFESLFRKIREIHAPEDLAPILGESAEVPAKDIGVFTCGPAVMMDNVDLACSQLNRQQQGYGYLHHFAFIRRHLKMATRLAALRGTRETFDKENAPAGIGGIKPAARKVMDMREAPLPRGPPGKQMMTKKAPSAGYNSTAVLKTGFSGAGLAKVGGAAKGTATKPQTSVLSKPTVTGPSGSNLKASSNSLAPVTTPGPRALLRDITTQTPAPISLPAPRTTLRGSVAPKTGVKPGRRLLVLADEKFNTPEERGPGSGNGRRNVRVGDSAGITEPKDIGIAQLSLDDESDVVRGNTENSDGGIGVANPHSGRQRFSQHARDDALPEILRSIGFSSDSDFDVESGVPRETIEETFIPDPETVLNLNIFSKPEPPAEWYKPEIAVMILNPIKPVFDFRDAPAAWLETDSFLTLRDLPAPDFAERFYRDHLERKGSKIEGNDELMIGGELFIE